MLHVTRTFDTNHFGLLAALLLVLAATAAACDTSLELRDKIYVCEGVGDCAPGYVCVPFDSDPDYTVCKRVGDVDASGDTSSTDTSDTSDTSSIDVVDTHEPPDDTEDGVDIANLSCDDGPPTSCEAAGLSCCPGAGCVDTATDVEHCGSCGNGCEIDCDGMACITVDRIDAGANHACAVLSDGTLRCWGYNGDGQLGPNASATRSAIPVSVGLTDVADVGCGADFTCARRRDGTVWCWGNDGAGQLGLGLGDDQTAIPTQVPGLSGVTQLTAGGTHACALAEEEAWCWGFNGSGALGLGDTRTSQIPARVQSLDRVQALDAGVASTCAIVGEQIPGTEILCWGTNAQAQPAVDELEPVSVVVAPLLDLAVGEGHACVVQGAPATVRCWGENHLGQSGIDKGTPNTGPITAYSGEVASLCAGDLHNCLVDVDGTVKCWGWNAFHQLGVDGVEDTSTPVSTPITGIREVACGGAFTCAVTVDGALICWGDNAQGNLARGSFDDVWEPDFVAWR